MKCLHSASAIMEYFLEGIIPLRYWYIDPNKKPNRYKSSALELTYQSSNTTLHLRKCSIKTPAAVLNPKFPFLSRQRSSMK